MLVASELATSGSVMAKQERISPSSSGSSQRARCSGVANRCSSSMLPVSGAEQLKISEAQWTRPMISASGAYSRLARRVPGSSSRRPGRNRFHRPSARASALQRLDHRGRPGARFDLALPVGEARHHVGVHEGAQLRAQRLHLGRIGEIHAPPPARRRHSGTAPPLVARSATPAALVATGFERARAGPNVNVAFTREVDDRRRRAPSGRVRWRRHARSTRRCSTI